MNSYIGFPFFQRFKYLFAVVLLAGKARELRALLPSHAVHAPIVAEARVKAEPVARRHCEQWQYIA